LLLIASGVAMTTRWVRAPYTLALVIVRPLISPMHFIPVVHVSPEVILLIFLPALLFEAAWNLRLDHLCENLAPILTLAVPGVLMAVGVVGAGLRFGVGWPWPTSLLLGTIVSATCPVSVLALFKKHGLPKRLNIIVEGESLINDGTTVVVFKIILAIAAGAAMEATMGRLTLDSLREFIKVVFG
jgi:Na+:H+ antiporter